MPHFYERNIVDIKNEYTTFLTNIMTPFMYEGIKSVYNFSVKSHNQMVEKSRTDPSVKSPGVLKVFQVGLKGIPTLNNNSLEEEAKRIKNKSKCEEWFDDLVRAVIKSNIVLLTFSTSNNQSEIVNKKYHETIDVRDFIHKCYIESARVIYNSPELFWHEYSPIEVKRNQKEICNLIEKAVHEAIRKMLPVKLILEEYLKNDYVLDNLDNKMSDTKYMDIQNMVKRDLHGGGEGDVREDLKSKFEGQSLLDDDQGNLLDNDNNNGYEELEEDADNLMGEMKDLGSQLKDLEKDYEKDDDYNSYFKGMEKITKSDESLKLSSRPHSRAPSEQHAGGSSRDQSEDNISKGSSRDSSRGSSRGSSRDHSEERSSRDHSEERSSRDHSEDKHGGSSKHSKSSNNDNRHDDSNVKDEVGDYLKESKSKSHHDDRDSHSDKKDISESDKSRFFSRYIL